MLTCVCLHNLDAVEDPILSAYCRGIIELIYLTRQIIQTATVYDEVCFIQ